MSYVVEIRPGPKMRCGVCGGRIARRLFNGHWTHIRFSRGANGSWTTLEANGRGRHPEGIVPVEAAVEEARQKEWEDREYAAAMARQLEPPARNDRPVVSAAARARAEAFAP